MTTPASQLSPFSYRAQSIAGQILSGTIDATDQSDAQQRLNTLQLQVLQLQSAPASPPIGRPRLMGREDFAAFNEQLAQLTRSGLPVEQGLRLVADEMGNSPMRAVLTEVAADLDAGKSLPQAIESHRTQFPPLYANLVDAGIRSGNLPAILLNLGRHLTLVRRLQAALWRTFSYPLVVMAFFIAVLAFIFARLMPLIGEMFKNYPLPLLTQIMLSISQALAGQGLQVVIVILAVVTIGGFVLLWMAGRDRNFAEGAMLRMPLIGPILRRNLISRWCDAVSIGVDAGMDLPAAISIADDAIASAALKADGEAIVAALTSGQPPSAAPSGRVLPPIVPAAIELASARNNLAEGLRGLSNLYQEQAELRIRGVQAILTPMIVIFMGILVGLLLLSIFAPIISLIEAISGPMNFHHH